MNKRFPLIMTLALLAACSGGGNSGNTGGDPFNPSPDIGVDADLASLAENTFLSRGIQIRTDPLFLEMEPTDQGKPVLKSISLINQSGSGQVFTVKVLSRLGGFALVEPSGGVTAHKPVTLASGRTESLTLKFDAVRLGTSSGFVEITAEGLDGHILFPFRAEVRVSKDMRLISSEYLCANEDAPALEVIDFKRVAGTTKKKKGFKLCNTGKNPLTLNAVRLMANASSQSSVFESGNVFDDFNWEVVDRLDPGYFDRSPINATEPFAEPAASAYPGPQGPAASAFRVTAREGSRTMEARNLTIQPGKYLRLEAEFAPPLDAEADEGESFQPVSYAVNMETDTNLGTTVTELLGASAGKEPMLKIMAGTQASEPAECGSGEGLDLDSRDTAIHFTEPATIFRNWIPEDKQEIRFRLCNAGSGSKPLKVWLREADSGFFSVIPDAQNRQFPLTLEPGESSVLTVRYSPTPPNGNIQSGWDLGQLVFRHGGGNGPQNPLVLIGEQQAAEIVQVFQDSSNLRNTAARRPYTATQRKNVQCVKIGSTSAQDAASRTKEFKIRNNSRNYSLTSTLSLMAPITVRNPQGTLIPGRGTAIRFPSGQATTVITGPLDESTFKIEFMVPAAIPPASIIEGRLRIANQLNAPSSRTRGKTPPQFDVYFKATASETGECAGAAVGGPPDGSAVVVIDRITMNMLGLDEPARNPPSFKFHLPIELNAGQKWARIHGLPYDPTRLVSPVKQIRSYAHQITNPNTCFPLPTNPYKLEFEEGSWDGPYGCTYKPADQPWEVKPAVACIDNNGTQIAKHPETQEDVNVFYHEFAKFDSADCGSPTPAIEGKISTFFLRQGETPREVFTRMEQDVGLNGTEDQYARHTLPYSFDSYIKFNRPYQATGCTHSAGVTLRGATDAEEIKACWKAMSADSSMVRANGFVEECSYFQFEIEEGCIPGAADCPGSDPARPDTWRGYGEYEPDPEDDTKYNLTLHNVRITAFTLVHSLAGLFDHPGRLLYSDLYVTLTTKGVGRTYPGNGNPNDDAWDSLIAKETRKDFPRQDEVLRPPSDNFARKYWIADGVNGSLQVGEEDQTPCNLASGPHEHCRGNFEFFNNKLIHAGEPVQLEHNNRLLLVGLSAFHGKGNMAPGFAREKANGLGTALFFTFQACIKPTEIDELTGEPKELDTSAGCYDPEVDDSAATSQYVSHGMLEPDDLDESNQDSKARINFRIYEDDRNRLTDYFNYPAHYSHNSDNDVVRKCGYGN